MDVELSPAAEKIATLIVVSVIFCSLAIWIMVFRRLWRRQPILPMRPRRTVPWRLVHVVLIFLIYFGLGFAAVTWVAAQAGVTIGQVLKDPRWMPVLFGAAAAAKVLTLASGAALLYLTAGAKGDDLGCGMKNLGGQFLLGLAAFVAITPPVLAIQVLTSMLVPYKHPLIESLKEDASLGNMILMTVLVVVVAPLVEEFLFRLVLQGWLQRFEWFTRGGPWLAAASAAADEPIETATLVDKKAAVVDGSSSQENPYASPAALAAEQPTGEPACDPNNVPVRPVLPLLGVVPICISSLVFALMHYGHGLAPIPLFVLALGLGYLYQRTGRLLPCILIHMLFNGTAMALLWLTVYSPA